MLVNGNALKRKRRSTKVRSAVMDDRLVGAAAGVKKGVDELTMCMDVVQLLRHRTLMSCRHTRRVIIIII